MSLEELRKIPTVLSKRNDLVLPRFYHQPITFEGEGTWKEALKGFFIGVLISAFLLPFYLLWIARPEKNREQTMSRKEKNGLYAGAFLNFLAMYIYLQITF